MIVVSEVEMLESYNGQFCNQSPLLFGVEQSKCGGIFITVSSVSPNTGLIIQETFFIITSVSLALGPSATDARELNFISS